MADENIKLKVYENGVWVGLNPETTKEQVTGLVQDLHDLDAIARGASRARVFDDEAGLDTWLAVPANAVGLQIGDNLYVRDTGTPDYWWDGTQKIPLETEGGAAQLNLASPGTDGLMSKEDFGKLAGIAANANNYAHPSADGSLHMPATGTGNNGKVLKAGSTPGSAAWGSLSAADLSINTVTVGLNAPANAKNGDIWFDYNNS